MTYCFSFQNNEVCTYLVRCAVCSMSKMLFLVLNVLELLPGLCQSIIKCYELGKLEHSGVSDFELVFGI